MDLLEIFFALNLNDVLIEYNLIEGERSFENYNPIILIILVGFFRFIFFIIINNFKLNLRTSQPKNKAISS